MKKIFLAFLASYGLYAQPQVFNVQHYCIDQAPFQEGQCDSSGNEYSFVFLDSKKQDVTFFFTNTRLKYKIVSSQQQTSNGAMVYILAGEKGSLEMHVNSQKTKIEFLYPETRIYLAVGKSTKAE